MKPPLLQSVLCSWWWYWKARFCSASHRVPPCPSAQLSGTLELRSSVTRCSSAAWAVSLVILQYGCSEMVAYPPVERALPVPAPLDMVQGRRQGVMYSTGTLPFAVLAIKSMDRSRNDATYSPTLQATELADVGRLARKRCELAVHHR